MKKIYLSLIAILSVCQFSFAQNTYPFPASGSVGIGTSTPAALLDLGNLPSIKQLIYGSGGDVGYYMGFGVDLGQAPNTLTAFIGPPSGDGTNGNGSFSIASATTTWPYSAYTTRFTVLSTGNVGIGTTSPNAGNMLEVNGSIATNPSGGLWLNATRSAGIADEGNGGTGNGSIYFRTGNSDGRMLINALGNVLIGKTTQINPAYILDVAGNVRANQIVVNSSGADFVFAASYKLVSLFDLKKYIDQNHHLPEIPSAKQMQAEGLNLGDNQIKLLQKVEELTLYLIEKDQKEKEQQTKINQQQAEIDQIKQQMALLMKKLDK